LKSQLSVTKNLVVLLLLIAPVSVVVGGAATTDLAVETKKVVFNSE